MSKLRFRVVFASGEDPEYPADELNVHSPHTKGWQSPRFCDYPQELGFALEGECKVNQIQILSHQNKIATRVELFVGSGLDYTSASFVRLGYLSLDSNERSNYQARELKSVYIDAKGSFFKLLTHRCHLNKYNLFNQVGIVAINLLGEPDNLPDRFEMSQSLQGTTITQPIHLASAKPSRTMNDLSLDMNFDPITAGKLRQLSEAKQRAVRNEDYILAKQIKMVESELRELGSRLSQLDVAKVEAVDVEDYDRAKLLKDEIDALRTEIEARIKTINIQGLEPDIPSSRTIAADSGRDLPADPPVRRTPRIDYSRDMSSAEKEYDAPAQVSLSRPTSRNPANFDDVEHDEVPVGAGTRRLPPPPRNVAYSEDAEHNEVVGGGTRAAKGRMPDPEPREDSSQETFPFGEHPLEGVPNMGELPNPEPLTVADTKDSPELSQLRQLVGDYLTRCYLSKVWALREAFFIKLKLMLPELVASPGFAAIVPPVAEVMKGGVDDKIAQVFFTSQALLSDFCGMLEEASPNLSRTQTQPLEGIIARLVGKLADGQARIRDTASQSLVCLARCTYIGPVSVCGCVVRPLPAKQKSNWRPIVSRLNMLATLVNEYGIGSSSGLGTDSVFEFIKTSNAFAHSSGEVRDAARDLCVAMHGCVGKAELNKYLTALRPKQREEYEEAFKAADAAKGGSSSSVPISSANSNSRAGVKTSMDVPREVARLSPARDTPAQTKPKENSPDATRGSGKGKNKQQQPAPPLPKTDGGGPQFAECMFCHVRGNWDEDGLDLHYWRECPMLIGCPACAQIVEIFGLSDHLAHECDESSQYVLDEVTGLAIKRSELKQWKSNPRYHPLTHGNAMCPLCLEELPGNEEGWKRHLSYECSHNPRLTGHP